MLGGPPAAAGDDGGASSARGGDGAASDSDALVPFLGWAEGGGAPAPAAAASSAAALESRLSHLRVAAAAASMGLPAVQAAHSLARSGTSSKRQDLCQAKAQLAAALRELAAVEYDVAGSRGASLGRGASDEELALRGRACEAMPTGLLVQYAREAQALAAELRGAEEEEEVGSISSAAAVAVGLPALEEFVSRHGPVLAQLGAEYGQRIREEAAADMDALGEEPVDNGGRLAVPYPHPLPPSSAGARSAVLQERLVSQRRVAASERGRAAEMAEQLRTLQARKGGGCVLLPLSRTFSPPHTLCRLLLTRRALPRSLR